jgi:hypothetical protein
VPDDARKSNFGAIMIAGASGRRGRRLAHCRARIALAASGQPTDQARWPCFAEKGDTGGKFGAVRPGTGCCQFAAFTCCSWRSGRREPRSSPVS